MAYSEVSHAVRQIAIKRNNLLNVARMAVKSLVDKSAFEPIEDSDEDLCNFCIIIEHIVSHRLQMQWSSTWFSSSNEPFNFWDIIKKFAPSNTVKNIEDMSNSLQTSSGKGRAWIRLVLVQKKLLQFFDTLLANQTKLSLYYQPQAFILSEETSVLTENLRCLNGIDFNQSSKEDDMVENKKLDKSLVMEEIATVHPSPTEELLHLREQLKTEKEQKNYFEELVTVRDGQLTQLQSQLHKLSKESESQQRQLESIILELQQQLVQKQQEIGKERRRVENYLLHATTSDTNGDQTT